MVYRCSRCQIPVGNTNSQILQFQSNSNNLIRFSTTIHKSNANHNTIQIVTIQIQSNKFKYEIIPNPITNTSITVVTVKFKCQYGQLLSVSRMSVKYQSITIQIPIQSINTKYNTNPIQINAKLQTIRQFHKYQPIQSKSAIRLPNPNTFGNVPKSNSKFQIQITSIPIKYQFTSNAAKSKCNPIQIQIINNSIQYKYQ